MSDDITGITPAEPAFETRAMALVQAVEKLCAAESLEDVIDIVRETARAISGADGVTFVLRDGAHCHYVEEFAIAPLWKGQRFPLESCISGWAMNHGESAVIPDIYADPRIPHAAYRPTFVKSLVMVPVGLPHPQAAIGSYWAQQRTFSPETLALLTALARAASSAIANAQTRANMKENERLLSLALTAGSIGIWELDLWDNCFVLSPIARESLGLADGRALTRDDLLAAVDAEDRTLLLQALQKATAHSGEMNIEVRSGGRWLEIRGRAVLDANGAAVRLAGVMLDVTDARLASERMNALRAELAHAARMDEMGEMVAGFAHELTQPLAAANNYMSAAARLLERADVERDKIVDMMRKAGAQFMGARDIIHRIRSFASKTPSARTIQPIREIITQAVELVTLDPRSRGVNLSVEVSEGLLPVNADRVQVQQVLVNLLRNAFEALHGIGNRAVRVSAEPVSAGNAIEVCIADNGPGLPPEIAANVFRPFMTSKEGGMGVGLALCRSIVESHDGRMWHAPRPGGGTEFHFTLPIAA